MRDKSSVVWDALIADSEEFGGGSAEDMVEVYLRGGEAAEPIHRFRFETPQDFDEEVVTLMARGFFFDAGYDNHKTISCVVNMTDVLHQAEEGLNVDDHLLYCAPV